MIKPVTTIFVISASILATTNYLAIEFYLYWYYPWIDLVTHFLGGAVGALGAFSLKDFWPRFPGRALRLSIIITFVFLVAVAWEAFEVWAGISMNEPGYALDTVLDLIMGLSGGGVGYFVGRNVRDLDL